MGVMVLLAFGRGLCLFGGQQVGETCFLFFPPNFTVDEQNRKNPISVVLSELKAW